VSLKICPQCKNVSVEFDGTFSRCLRRDCCWMIRGQDYKEPKPQHHKFSEEMVRRVDTQKKTQEKTG
jgi:Zn-finger nucleic acid-binding protein